MRSPTTVTSALSLALPRTVIDAEKVIKVGMLAPLSGKMKSWAEPGFMGCLIWKDWVNGKGGIRIGDRRYQVDVIPYDTQFRPEKALAGARKLLMDHGVQLVMMLGGNDFSRPLRDFVNQRKALVTTLLPTTSSGGMPNMSPASTRIRSTLPVVLMNTRKPLARSRVMSSRIGP